MPEVDAEEFQASVDELIRNILEYSQGSWPHIIILEILPFPCYDFIITIGIEKATRVAIPRGIYMSSGQNC